jgi:hypothetical protein
MLDSAIVFSLSSYFGGSTAAPPTEAKAASAAGDREVAEKPELTHHANRNCVLHGSVRVS